MITWITEKRKVTDLKPAGYNPRQASDKDKVDLGKSLERFNVADPLIINQDNTIIGGHFRHRMLLEKGVDEVDVRVPSRQLTDDEEQELNLRLNKNLGAWDWDALANFDEEMLKDIGFTEEEMLENFGLNEAEQIELDADRMEVITVQPPEAPKLWARQTFYCEDKETFDRIKEYFGTDRDGHLNIGKLLEMMS